MSNKFKLIRKLKELGILPHSLGGWIALLIIGLAEVFFLILVLMLNILPIGYLIGVILFMVAMDVLIQILINTKSKHGTRRIVAMVLFVFMLNVLMIGDYYVYSTYDTLQRISAQRDTWEYYDVVALKDGSCQDVSDLTGATVYEMDMDSKQLTEASERLVTKADVKIETVSGLIALGQKLVDDGSSASGKSVAHDANATEEDIAAAAEKQATSPTDLSDMTEDEGTGEVENPEADQQKEKADKTEEGSSSGKERAKNLNDNAILVSHSGYNLIKSNIKGFKKNTQILYKLKVKKRADDSSKAVDVTKDSFNVLISGMDVWGTIDQQALSDVNMVMTVNPTTREILLTSIPRDSYIPLHSFGQKDKLTHSGIYGSQETLQTIEDFLDTEINYTVKVNFSMLVDVVNAIHGITVHNDIDFESSVKGWHYKEGDIAMTGRQALWFARERKSFPDGDMQRNKNQQKVLAAIIKKVTSSKVLLTSYAGILDAVEDEMSTDLTDRDLKRLAKMQLRDMRKWTIHKVSIEGSTGGAPCYSMGGENLSCVFPYDEDVEKAKQAIHDVMYPVNNTEQKNEPTTTTGE